jgi:hypothetical protein
MLVVDGTSGVTFNDSSLQGAAASPYVLKNRLINGDMRIDQRNAGASVTASTTGNEIYTLDRWSYYASQASKFSVQQNAAAVTPPAGFTNYLGITSSSAYSITSSDWFTIKQSIEGFNGSDLGWGTANAKTVTLSFWVRSSLTGTFGGSVRNSLGNRSYPFSYSIPVANTWTLISITIAGDTSGTWATDNTTFAQIFFGLGVGSSNSGTAGAWAASGFGSATGATSVVGTNGATFYITGVQLEIGTSATPFERRVFSQELINCQRYFEKTFPQNIAPAHNTGVVIFLPNGGSAGCGGNTYWSFEYKVTKRTDCTIRSYDPTGTGTATSNLWRTYTACNAGTQGSGLNLSTACDSFFSGYTQGGTGVTTAFLWTAECEL